MNAENIQPAILMATATAFSLFVAAFTYVHRKGAGRTYFVLMMIATAFWAFTSAAEYATNPIQTKIFWSQISYLGVVAIPSLWFLFAAQYSHQTDWLSPRRRLLVWIVPAIAVVLAFTHPAHNLIWTKIEPISSEPGARLVYDHGNGFWVYVAHAYVLTLVGTYWLLRLAFRSHTLYRYQVITLVLSVFIPWSGNLVYLLDFNPWPGLDLTPLAFSITGILMAWGLFNYRIFQLSPIARDALVEGMRDGVLVVNADSYVEDINSAARRILGLSATLGVGRLVTDLFPNWASLIDQFAATGEGQVELEREQSQWLELRFMPIFDMRHREPGRLIILRDITDKKRIEAELAAERNFFEQIMKNIPSGITVTNGSGRFVYVNPAFAQMLGYSPEDLLGKTPYNCLQADDHAQLAIEQLRRRQGISSSYETHLASLNGETIPVLINSAPYMNGDRFDGAIAVVTDLTERKEIEENLRYREGFEQELVQLSAKFINFASEELDDVLNHALERIGRFCRVDRVYITLLNEMQTEISNTNEWCAEGIQSQMARLQNLPCHLIPNWIGALMRGENIYIPAVRDLPPAWQFEKLNLVAQGIKSVIAVPLVYAQTLLGFVGVDSLRQYRTWSEEEIRLLGLLGDLFAGAIKRKEVEESLLETNRQLAEATVLANEMAAQAEAVNQAKSQFLANMSHEIRTPMNGVFGMTALLINTSLTEEQQHYTETIRTSAESLLAVINDILDFSKIEAGRIDLESIEFDVHDLIEAICDTFGYSAAKKGLELTCLISQDLPRQVKGDPERIRQILNNLIGNAIKFTAQGDVQVKATLAGLEPDAATLRFQIIDTGIGIPQEKIGQLFMPFIQLDASTTRQFGGSGLGLSISKKLTEMMKGDIGLESEAGRGSTFWFTVRVGRPEYSRPFELDRYADLRAIKVLLVDDNPAALATLAAMLADVGCACTALQDPAAALPSLEAAASANDPFQIVLLDYSLPGKNGDELASAIQARYAVNIILLMPTGAPLNSDQSHQLLKPIRRANLYNCLTSRLRGDMAQVSRTAQINHTPIDDAGAFLGRNVRVLLVEDNPVNQDVATSILRKNHVNVDAVSNGQEAIQALSNRLYDLVLMDVHMPVMDGCAATVIIRDEASHVLNHRIPIVALTASAMQGDQEMCMRAGMDDYMAKPIRPEELLAKLNRWLAISLSRVNSNSGYMQNRPYSALALAQKSPAPVAPISSLAVDEAQAHPVIEIEQLCQRMMDDRALAMDLLRKSATRLDADLEEVKAAYERNDFEFLKQMAHKLKGSAANLSAEPLRQTCEQLEKAAAAEDCDLVAIRVAALAAAVSNFQEAVRNFLE